MNFWMSIMYFIIGGIIGGGLGYFLTRRSFEKQLKENPPINEKMIRAIMKSMGQ